MEGGSRTTFWVHGDGPVKEVEINIIQTQALQAHIQVLLDARCIGAPYFRGDPDVFPLDSGVECLL